MKSRTPVRVARWARVKDGFWGAVVDCLVEFHNMARADAASQSDELRHKLDNPPPGLMDNLYLHEEPCYIACDIAETELDLDPLYPQYELILQRHDW
jgi:hypothetical protein